MKFIVVFIIFLFILNSSISTFKINPKKLNKNKHKKFKLKNSNKKESFFSDKETSDNYYRKNIKNENPNPNITKLIEKILMLEELIINENISAIDDKVISDELFLISKGKVESLDKLTVDQLKKMNMNQLKKIKSYLSEIPKMNNIVKNNSSIEKEKIKENDKQNLFSHKNHFPFSFSEITNGNEDISKEDYYDVKQTKQKQETLFKYLNNVNEKIKKNKHKRNKKVKKFGNNFPQISFGKNHPKDRFKSSFSS